MGQIEVKTVRIPEGVTVNLEGKTVEVTGEKGRLVRDFSLWARRKVSALVGTVCSHIGNMVKGVTAGFTYRLKVVFSHFPISVKVQQDGIVIENFIGERSPRIAKIVGETKVSVKDDDIIVQGLDIEEVSQTAANIEQATKVKERDPRKFLDGIYVYEKLEGTVG